MKFLSAVLVNGSRSEVAKSPGFIKTSLDVKVSPNHGALGVRPLYFGDLDTGTHGYVLPRHIGFPSRYIIIISYIS